VQNRVLIEIWKFLFGHFLSANLALEQRFEVEAEFHRFEDAAASQNIGLEAILHLN
jgi:hypothetical protein